MATGDVDKDGVIEIVTVGCTSLNDMCDPDMRIWSIAGSNTIAVTTLLVIIGTATILVIAITIIYFRKRRANITKQE